MYQVCYCRFEVSFNLWIGSVLKHYKVPKHYDKDCEKHGPFGLSSWPPTWNNSDRPGTIISFGRLFHDVKRWYDDDRYDMWLRLF